MISAHVGTGVKRFSSPVYVSHEVPEVRVIGRATKGSFGGTQKRLYGVRDFKPFVFSVRRFPRQQLLTATHCSSTNLDFFSRNPLDFLFG
ncbi:uncharacterized protein YALI1_C28115g [Yarrowia lipolytica]|uniref:Uncharacterized protein n=1 Tax=Yarrowia lipolytica TaxID=4952 RepID=A0A1D8NBZ4_YARLL|nr:hypothetical protein YALI1_C28115g [Yarrowia lipolytica]